MESPTPKQRRKLAAQRRRTHNVILAGTFLLVILLFALINLCTKTKTFSESENRNLAQRPHISLSTIADGSYFSNMTSYFSDQFFARDGWISLKLKEDSLLGRKENGGVYLCSNGYLISKPEAPDQAVVDAKTAAINQFVADHSDVAFRIMVVPDAASILADYLPSNAPVRNQTEDIAAALSGLSSSIQSIDVASILQEHKDEYIYYKTDHHWSSLGAYYTFSASSGILGIGTPIRDYDIYTVTNSFQGTLSSKSGSHSSWDSIDIYDPKGTGIDYYVNYLDTQTKVCSLYQSECLKAKDQYTVFFGGNHPILEIKTTANNDRSLLIFKDSYANCFVPFLVPYYENIVMVDSRYYYDSVDTVMNSYGITDVLFFYSGDTYLTDSSLVDVLTAGTPETAPMPEVSGTTPVSEPSAPQESSQESALEPGSALDESEITP